MKHQIARYMELAQATSQTAGGTSSSDITGTVMDMKGYDGVYVIGRCTNASTSPYFNIHLHSGTSSGTSNHVDIEASAAYFSTALTGTVVQIDCYRPPHRYVEYVVDRQTTDDAIDAVFAFRYHAWDKPVSHSTTLGGSSGVVYLANPSSGSAT